MTNTPSLRVALGQLASSTEVDENLASAVALVREAADAGAQLVVLPEATIANFSRPAAETQQELDGPFATSLRETATDAGVVVVAGMFEPSDDGRRYNTLLVTGRAGDEQVETSYRKVHLFDAFGAKESDTIHPGAEYVTFDLAGVRIGLATCYDLRFAEQFTQLGVRGAEVVCVSAAWGDGPSKAEQWDLLTRARALDSQAWLLACDQAWQPPQGAAPLGVGRSVVVDPLGAVRARLSSGPGLIVTDLDLAYVAEVRRRVPVLASLTQDQPGPA